MLINFKKVLLALKKLPWRLGEAVFPLFLGMIFLGVFAGAALVLEYIFLLQPTGTPVALPVFEKDKLKDIMEILRLRSVRFQATDSEDYPDPFSPKGKLP